MSFWTGPWTVSGYVQQGLNFYSAVMPAVGMDRSTRGELWNLEMYVQQDRSRYEKTIQALKWFSDNTFWWSTQGRGPCVRKSVLARPDFMTAGSPPRVRGAFIDGAQYATFYRPPIVATEETISPRVSERRARPRVPTSSGRNDRRSRAAGP